MIVFIAVFVGVILIAMYLPMFSMMSTVGWNHILYEFKCLIYLPKNIKLIDLSADFRLKNSLVYKKWYGINHNCKNLINKSKSKTCLNHRNVYFKPFFLKINGLPVLVIGFSIAKLSRFFFFNRS